ncbi:MAG TPA: MFS transporter, partial [Gaiellaceae bacterium]|nr:MFS transporter [Gaiellaceae bacterium]
MRRILRTYFPPLPRSVLTLQAGGLLNAFGNGVVLPFLLIYLHNVRGIDLASAGLVVGAHAASSVVAGPVFGAQIDRIGAKATLAAALAVLTVGYAGYALVHEAWHGFLVAVVSGVGAGGFWPAQSTLVAGLTPHWQRPAAFAMQRVVMSLGIGLGALAGGAIAATDAPGTFVALFLLDAATFALYAAVMLALVPEPARAGGHAPGRAGSYREVLRHRPFVAVVGLNALFIFAGFSGFEVLPVYAKNEAGLAESEIGALFAVNTAVIVLAQAPVARLARGRRRMRTLALLGLTWAAAWLLVPFAGTSPSAALWLLAATMAAFALGQSLHGAVSAPLVAGLTPHWQRPAAFAMQRVVMSLGIGLGALAGGAIAAT